MTLPDRRGSGFCIMPKSKEPWLKCRHVVILLAMAVQFHFSALRNCIGVAIVAMVNNTALPKEQITSDACPSLLTNLSESEHAYAEKDGEFTWSPKLQGYILGSSQLLYVVAVIFSGKLTELVGSKNVLFVGTLLSALLTAVSPFAAWCHVYLLIFVQGLRGFFQGGFHPAQAALTAKWCPLPERGFSQTLMFTGLSLGSALGNVITGILCKTTLLEGWPLGFFVLGATGLLTAILLSCFMYNSPNDHPKISQAELLYIQENQGSALNKKKPKTPWTIIFTSIPVYALAFAFFGHTWALSHFVSLHATFLGTVMHYPIQQNGLFSALPFLLQIPFALGSGWVSRYLNKKNYMTVNTSRKFWNFMGALGYSVCMLGVCFSGCNRSVIVALSILAFSATGCAFSGCWITPIDMSPTFAASVTAVALTFGLTSNFIVPVLGGILTDGKQTLDQWHKIIYISIAIAMSCASIFAIFGSAEVQPWDNMKAKRTVENDEDIDPEMHRTGISLIHKYEGDKNRLSAILKVK